MRGRTARLQLERASAQAGPTGALRVWDDNGRRGDRHDTPRDALAPDPWPGRAREGDAGSSLESQATIPMNRAATVPTAARPRTGPRIDRAARNPSQVAYWKINGFPASIVIWTAEEWETLVERPSDAQYYPCGVWCALRLE